MDITTENTAIMGILGERKCSRLLLCNLLQLTTNQSNSSKLGNDPFEYDSSSESSNECSIGTGRYLHHFDTIVDSSSLISFFSRLNLVKALPICSAEYESKLE